MPLSLGFAAWCAEAVLIAWLAATPQGARLAVILAGSFLPLAALVAAAPMPRCLLACCMGMTFVRTLDLRKGPKIPLFGARLAHLFSLVDLREVNRKPRKLDLRAAGNLFAATFVVAVTIAVVKAVPSSGPWLALRWLTGGIGLLAIAEMATACHDLITGLLGVEMMPLFDSPHLSTSLGEYWTKRWNLPVSVVLHRFVFAPLARRGTGLALSATFAISALGHALIADLALKSRKAGLVCGAFFLIQPLFIALERRLRVRRWTALAGWTWTMLVLAITCPLLVDPVLQMADKTWGTNSSVLQPTAAILCFVISLTLITSIAPMTSRIVMPADSRA